MSDTTASLARQAASAGDLLSVVRVMKALAAASIGQYERSVRALAGYRRAVELGLGARLRAGGSARQIGAPRGRRAHAAVGAVVFGSDQGLVGQFNDSVADLAVQTLADLPGKPVVWAVGERVHARLTDAGLLPVGFFAVPSSTRSITPLVGEIQIQSEERLAAGDCAALYVFHNRPHPGVGHSPVANRLLPLDAEWIRDRAQVPWPTKLTPEILGPGDATLRALVREHLFITLFQACAESLASENATRLAAMQRAEKNIGELLERLQSSFHRLRQSGIDEELFDVISGFEALTPYAPRSAHPAA